MTSTNIANDSHLRSILNNFVVSGIKKFTVSLEKCAKAHDCVRSVKRGYPLPMSIASLSRQFVVSRMLLLSGCKNNIVENMAMDL
ncbi:hypothetical protein BC937DRAFT_94296 [Endogone sp. FLAS-F59071]|nr:hypothetical protein BC937DRAFT_94296 [Endogone sp. FLAS-F59071]RUS14127.1 hypothetical protein BC937DRAFT_94296 [Endogone sp. FLAS-F59071]|eukprot:RUS14126.1 hypothetical protein BC937DRAFT_94296 [Endogone sp. FLAS-F59071]